MAAAVGTVANKNVDKVKKPKKLKMGIGSGEIAASRAKHKKRGTYKVQVKVKVTGDAAYESAAKIVTCKVKVR